ncbi:1,4-dihydroxy-2-naphthoate octaprenyltransferase [Salmonella enterica subsp. enterica]|uniref:1,4-dihydroxy-2-naphthoate octaprenyltransferase n=1 Tax=Salmonella enterica I TaxID=59201 RepID=A0A379X2V3_SALET|nr:1,4-dihydroxy-2-naphthoate octaprenyltransferase [Salmonella enterica subsp. enterica]
MAVACHTLTDFCRLPDFGRAVDYRAITYTVGNRPYGYIGLGDISVLVFFGWLSVHGELVSPGGIR